MKHDEAIKILDNIVYQDMKELHALGYAIEQLKQCEVFDEPVEMNLKDIGDSMWVLGIVIGKFKGCHITENADGSLYGWLQAEPIKKPLRADEWKVKYDFNDDLSFAEAYKDYNEYLKQFNNK